MQTPTFIWCKDKLRIHKNSPKVPHIFAYVGFFYTFFYFTFRIIVNPSRRGRITCSNRSSAATWSLKARKP